MTPLVRFFIQALRRTLSNIRSNRQVFGVSIVTISIALFILGLFLVIFVNLNSFLVTWSNQVQLIVYLEDGISSDQRQALEQLIRQEPDVESTEYVSKQAAWEKFKNTLSGKNKVLEDLEFNPLPGSYNIRFQPSSQRLEKIRRLVNLLKDKPGVESLEFGEKWISGFEKFMIFTRIFLLAIGALLSLGLILIISNTIKLSYYSRQEEIELMLLIGATYRFIKVPFLFEGMIQGLVGAILALGLVKSVHWYMQLQFQGSLESITRGMEFQFISQPLILGLIGASMLIGWIGSYLSIRQFLYSDR